MLSGKRLIRFLKAIPNALEFSVFMARLFCAGMRLYNADNSYSISPLESLIPVQKKQTESRKYMCVYAKSFQNWTVFTLFVAITCISGCSSSNISAPVSDSPIRGYHQVMRGETLYSIAFRYGLDYRQLAKLNHLKPPYKIHPKQKLRLNAITAKKLTTHPIKKHMSVKQITSKTKRIAKTKPTYNKVHKVSKTYSRITWYWPVHGTIISKFSPSVAGNKGIDIAGTYGQPIYAAAPGYVVYCGNGLRGYGNLIIIKHNQEYLSAYAHNSTILVKEGMFIKAGQMIAKMGNSDSSRIKLHFEIRYEGKPVNPINYLPKLP